VRPPKLAMKAALGSLVAAAILGMGAVSASAAPNPGYGTGGSTVVYGGGPTIYNNDPSYPSELFADGPQTANVPTLAWVGEEVRLVACDRNIRTLPFEGDFQTAEFNVEEWTGDQAFAATPTFDGSEASNTFVSNTGGASFFFPSGFSATSDPYKGCVSANIKSLHAGLSIVKLDVNQQSVGGPSDGNNGGNGGGSLDPTVVYSQQFVVIWMTPSSPTISEASVTSLGHPGTPGTDAPPTLFDQLTGLGTTNATGTCPATVPPSPVPSALNNCSGFLGDPSGNGVFSPDQWGAVGGTGGSNDAANYTPSTNNGLVDIRVTGSFPIEDAPPSTTNAQFFGQPSFTLPNDWAKLAGILATSSIQNTGIEPDLWDIHGGPTNTPLMHVAGLSDICSSANVFTSLTDSVDSCANNGNGIGNNHAFSRVFGDVTNGPGGTVGPYDTQAPNETLLSDGKLNSDDAPMPALPVTVSLTNPDALGGLYGVAKWLIYSHDFNGSPSPTAAQTATNPVALTNSADGAAAGTGNLYNPFYSEYIPSTTRPINEGSGVTGVYGEHFDYVPDGSSGNDFPGFANGDTDPYTFWTALEAGTTDGPAVSNGCMEDDPSLGQSEEFRHQAPSQAYVDGINYYATPDYPTTVLVYTDERGEAYVDYNPGTGFYYTPPTNPDVDGACMPTGTLGTATIQAQANYPYQTVPYKTPAASNTITKTVVSQWSKTLTALPKDNNSGNNVSVVVAHAQNINGQAFSGEEVCLQAPPAEFVQWIGPEAVDTAGGFDLSGSEKSHDNPSTLTNSSCGYTGTAGNVAFDVSGSQSPTNVDVQAEFMTEHVLEDLIIPSLGQTTTVTTATVIPAQNVNLQSGGNGGLAVTTITQHAGGINACAVKSLHVYSRRHFAKFTVTCTGTKVDSVVLRSFRHNGAMVRATKLTVRVGKTVTIRLGKKVAHLTVSV